MQTKTGDILGALERGTESVASTLEHLFYSVIPTVTDILIAMFYLTWKFGWIYAAIVGIQIVMYILLTAYAIEKRSKYQSTANNAENDKQQAVLESLLNHEVVKCFGNEEFEKGKYSRTLRNLQRQQYAIGVMSGALQIFQVLIINVGLLACSLLIISAITRDTHFSAGDYVLFTSYLAQLYGPLNYLGGYYRFVHEAGALWKAAIHDLFFWNNFYIVYTVFYVQTFIKRELRVNLIDAEYMLEYFGVEPQIQNSPDARELEITQGNIEFRNVCLSGDSGETVLQNVSFSVASNTTVALVQYSNKNTTIYLITFMWNMAPIRTQQDTLI